MKLYTKPGACSTADHIALQWAGQPFEVKILTAAEMKSPEYLKINPTGAVPAITAETADGETFTLTQNAAILGYIADKTPEAGLAGNGTAEQRATAMRWLAFVNSDVHPAFKPLFGPGKFLEDESQHPALKDQARENLRKLFEQADKQLDGRKWIAGFRSVADPYLYITLRWAHGMDVDLSGLQHLAAFEQRMKDDAGVQAALKAEGLD